MALEFFVADVEQTDSRIDPAKHGMREDSPHHGEIDQVISIAFDICAEIEEHALATSGRKDSGNGWPVNLGQHTQ